MTGEVVYFYAYDIAYEADLSRIEKHISGVSEQFRLGHLKDAPRDFPVYRPLTVQVEDLRLDGPRGPLTLPVFIKLFSVGAVSVQVRAQVACESIGELAIFHHLRFGDGTTLDERVQTIVAGILDNLRPHLDTPVAALQAAEVYTVFCLNSPLPSANPAAGDEPVEPADQWLARNRRQIAALLDGEADPARLSEQEVEETLKYRYSYYNDDLAVVDWDTALVIDRPEDYQDTLYVLEVANLQLEELKVYDAKLDAVVDKAYDDVELVTRPQAIRSRQRVIAELREIRMDLTKVADELSNITKFFGDWHLARIYMGCATRFHLADWEDMVSQKLRTLDSLYTILQQDSMNRVMLLLETAIVALFIIDLIVIVILGVK